jgi:hypothetical protein
MEGLVSEGIEFDSSTPGLQELKLYIFGMLDELARLAHDAHDDALADRLRAITLSETDRQSEH